ncbi:alpha/beta hydrolase [Ideonella azotifigens]|uniref:Alpha/beta hydrolase n=1 Tax=Ideonella azotifigens TaxID=513160 RepID=A0ABP3VRZ2_9BURK|nr:alpha/beta hydrolase [Ideonella azotifigens]MCD2339535.1 alpha/beta hydrolase [Ideonella azotifigens]
MKPIPALAVAILSATTMVASAVTAAPAVPAHADTVIKNVVLVHGATVDGSYWEQVYRELSQKGYHVTIAQHPLTSFGADVAATQRVLSLQDGPVVLVGHSYGGAVITAAGSDEKVKALVYVAAHAPDAEESVADLNGKYPMESLKAVQATPDGYIYVDRSKWREVIGADTPKSYSDFAAANQVLTNGEAFGAKLQTAAWHLKPTYALVTTDDKTVSPDLQRFMYERAKAQTVEVKASHSVLVSQPKAVVDLIVTASKLRSSVAP